MKRKEKRSLFSKIFGTKKPNETYGTQLEMLSGWGGSFKAFDGLIYNTSARSCIDAIARNAAKLNPKHIRSKDKKFEKLNNNITRLIGQRPNEMMNAYDFYYKIVTYLYLDNDAFVYIMRDEKDNPIGLYPIRSKSVRLYEYKQMYFVQFSFSSGKTKMVAYDDVIHLKRMFCENDILGGDNTPIIKALSFKQIINEGIINAIKTTQGIKGILYSLKTMLNPTDIRQIRDDFISSFVEDNETGIGALDSTTKFEPVKIEPQTATDSQISGIDKEIKDYYGVNDHIIQSNYSEDEWNAFYESVIEPIGIMLGLEFTNKLFTLSEINHGNKIVFEANRLQYASNKTKIEVAQKCNNYMTINEIREIFNLPPIDDGDKIMQDLNHINNKIADNYQGGEE